MMMTMMMVVVVVVVVVVWQGAHWLNMAYEPHEGMVHPDSYIFYFTDRQGSRMFLEESKKLSSHFDGTTLIIWSPGPLWTERKLQKFNFKHADH